MLESLVYNKCSTKNGAIVIVIVITINILTK